MRFGIVRVVATLDAVLLVLGVAALTRPPTPVTGPGRAATGPVVRSTDTHIDSMPSSTATDVSLNQPTTPRSRVAARPPIGPHTRAGTWKIHSVDDTTQPPPPRHHEADDTIVVSTLSTTSSEVRQRSQRSGDEGWTELIWRADGEYRAYHPSGDISCRDTGAFVHLPLAPGTAWTSRTRCQSKSVGGFEVDTDWVVLDQGAWRVDKRSFVVWRISVRETTTAENSPCGQSASGHRTGMALYAPELGMIVHEDHRNESTGCSWTEPGRVVTARPEYRSTDALDVTAAP